MRICRSLKYFVLLSNMVFMCSCVQQGPSSKMVEQSSELPSQDRYRNWVQEISVGMAEKELVGKKGDPDISMTVSETEYVYYYWEDREHIPVYIHNGKVVQVGGEK